MTYDEAVVIARELSKTMTLGPRDILPYLLQGNTEADIREAHDIAHRSGLGLDHVLYLKAVRVKEIARSPR